MIYLLYFNGKIVTKLISDNLADATMESCRYLERRFNEKCIFGMGQVGASVAFKAYVEKGAKLDDISVHAIHSLADVDHMALFDKKQFVFVVNPI